MAEGNITVTEEVYAVVDGGRTVLAAAVGDELTLAEAERFGVGPDGKSTTGVGPATELLPEDAATTEETSGTGEAGPLGDLNATDAIAAIGKYDAATLDAARAEETAKGDKARKTVVAALDARAAELAGQS